MDTITTETKEELFLRIGKQIEETEQEVFWDTRYPMEKHTKKRIFEIGIVAWFDELREYNFDHICSVEGDLIKQTLEEHKDEICELYDIPEDSFNASDYREEVEGYYPLVYINPKDVFNGETVNYRLVLHSNFDCLNSHHFESQGGYSYRESYFGDLVDALNLCPQTLKKAMVNRFMNVTGSWPTRKHRHGKELVDYDTFLIDLENNCAPAGLLTIPISVDLIDVWEIATHDDVPVEKVVVPKGAHIGIFDSMYGSGSIIETPLSREITIDLTKTGDTEYDHWSLLPDTNGYGIKSVYGVGDSFFTESTIL